MSTVVVGGATGAVATQVAARLLGASRTVIGLTRGERAATGLTARCVSVKKLDRKHAALQELARAVSEVGAVVFAAGVGLKAPIAELEAIGRDGTAQRRSNLAVLTSQGLGKLRRGPSRTGHVSSRG